MDLAIELPLGDSQSQALLRSEEGVVTKNIDHIIRVCVCHATAAFPLPVLPNWTNENVGDRLSGYYYWRTRGAAACAVSSLVTLRVREESPNRASGLRSATRSVSSMHVDALFFSCCPLSLCMDDVLVMPCLRVYQPCRPRLNNVYHIFTMHTRADAVQTVTTSSAMHKGIRVPCFSIRFTLISLPFQFSCNFFKFHSPLQPYPTLLPPHPISTWPPQGTLEKCDPGPTRFTVPLPAQIHDHRAQTPFTGSFPQIFPTGEAQQHSVLTLIVGTISE